MINQTPYKNKKTKHFVSRQQIRKSENKTNICTIHLFRLQKYFEEMILDKKNTQNHYSMVEEKEELEKRFRGART